jgi:hypothetical protein
MPNTDNAKGKLLVTVFAFLPAGRQALSKTNALYCRAVSLKLQKSCT